MGRDQIMLCQPRFRVGDTAWVMEYNKPVEVKIVKVNIYIHEEKAFFGTTITQSRSYVVDGTKNRTFQEPELCTSKEVLLSQL